MAVAGGQDRRLAEAGDVDRIAALERALAALETPARPNSAALAGCRRRLDRKLAALERRISDLLAHGRFDDARTVLAKIDMRFGGLAAPQSVKWQRVLDAPR